MTAADIASASGAAYSGPDLVADAGQHWNEAAFANCVFGSELESNLHPKVGAAVMHWTACLGSTCMLEAVAAAAAACMSTRPVFQSALAPESPAGGVGSRAQAAACRPGVQRRAAIQANRGAAAGLHL